MCERRVADQEHKLHFCEVVPQTLRAAAADAGSDRRDGSIARYAAFGDATRQGAWIAVEPGQKLTMEHKSRAKADMHTEYYRFELLLQIVNVALEF